MLLSVSLNLAAEGPPVIDLPLVSGLHLVGLVGRLATCAVPGGRLPTCGQVVGRVPTLTAITGGV